MSRDSIRRVVVAGHICVDIIPTFENRPSQTEKLLAPGELVNVGPAVVATGGAVSNTGLALHRLGIETGLVGKIADDLFGQAILDVLRSRDPSLAEGMVVTQDAPSSYTIVISPPGMERSFLHCPGANDTFGPEDIDVEKLRDVRLFHFGYPPLMRRMYIDGGHELTALLHKVHAAGITTSLDLAHIDQGAAVGRIDWRRLLEMALPEVDLFVPSLDEVFPILQPARFRETASNGVSDFMAQVDTVLLHELAEELLTMGVAVVCLKMGKQGIYLRTTRDERRLNQPGSLPLADHWLDRELLAPAFDVDVIGTTGAGDCAIAGFIAGIVRGQLPEEALTSSVAAGGANVEQADAISGVPTWDALQTRIDRGWSKLPLAVSTPGWRYDSRHELFVSPVDPSFSALPAQ
jgi:sugar/nucleoside kinase (ribokinase family)